MSPKYAPKTHLRDTPRYAACGLERPARSTKDVDKVTCERCKRTLLMADAEMVQSRKPRHLRSVD